jgi:hypothetical protein
MTINPEVKEILQQSRISLSDGLSYLIAMYYGYSPSYVPETLIQKINRTGLIGEQGGEIRWFIPLFEEQITGFEWVTKWMDLFGEVNKERRGVRGYVMIRMKAFFVNYPDVRKDEVIDATKMYIRSLDNPKYLKKSHKFIMDGQGVSKYSELYEWVEKLREFTHKSTDRTSSSITMR